MSEFERALRTLAPPASRMDRDRLMFLAGRASALAVGRSFTPSASPLKSRWLWPAATFASTCCAAVLAVLLALHGNTPPAAPPQIAGPTTDRDDAPAIADDATRPSPSTVAADQHGSVEQPSSTAASRRQNTSAVSPGLFAFAGRGDNSRLPAYLKLRQLVLEQGIDALPSSKPSNDEREPLADAHASPSRPLRAIDRPGRSASDSDDLLNEFLLPPRGDNL